MRKNISRYLGVFVLLLFSFYYTDKAVEIVKRNDPVMKSILEVEEKYKVSSVSAIIDGDTIVPGLNGVEVDVDESYKKMKKVNGYYESMLTLKEVIPDDSVLRSYDKFIVKGNGYKSDVALVVKVNNANYLEKAYQIFLDKNATATFFMDGTIIEDKMNLIEKMAGDGFELENFGYNDTYQESMFSWTNNMLYSITNKEPLFCYSEYNNYDILKLCSRNEMYTIRPTLVVKSSPFYSVKSNLQEGSIISLSLTQETIKELPTILSYIKQKGYQLVTLEEVISEAREVEK